MVEGGKAMGYNPVEHCLLKLCDRWSAFQSDTTKRLLVWQADPNALRFYQCFFEIQKHPSDFTVGDLFVVFDTPFEHAIQYSRELKKSLAGQYEASREDLVQQGIQPDWQFNPEAFPDSAAGFVRSLLSFGSKHHERIGHLVAALMPAEVANNDSFASWLTSALKTQYPERMRFVVIDSLETPRLDRLNGSGNTSMQFESPRIDALATAQETFAQESAAGPAGVFRNHLIGLMTLVEKGKADQVKIKAADALKFARKEKWADQEVVIAMLVAGAMLKEKRFAEALKGYAYARQTAERATVDGQPTGPQLVLQTWFGEAGVHLAAGDYDKAVQCYDQAAVLAQQIPNPILGIEAFRMGSFCLARMNDAEPAIRRGWNVLELGQRLKPEARSMTTLPIAAIDLLRIIEPQRVEGMEHIAYQRKAHIDAARHKADQYALELADSQDPRAFHSLEAELDKEIVQARQTAARQIDTLAAGASEPFNQVFSRSREMLSPEWPLNTLIGVPDTPQPAGGDTSP
jgi:tetratricopeptide (TPR) repeat protein